MEGTTTDDRVTKATRDDVEYVPLIADWIPGTMRITASAILSVLTDDALDAIRQIVREELAAIFEKEFRVPHR